MARISLVDTDPDDEVLAEVFRPFREEGREPIWLYRALAHSPRLLRGYAGAARALRHEATTPRALRELVIMRTGLLTGSRYEQAHHWKMALAAGLSEEQLRALGDWEASELFTAPERAALRAAEEVHALAVTDETFAELERHFSAEEIVELVMTASFYQLVARMLQALGVDVEPEYER